MNEIQANVLRVFLLAIHSYLYSFALKFIFLQTQATSYSFYSALLYTVKERGGKPDRKPHPLPALIKKKIKFSSYIRKFRVEQLQSLLIYGEIFAHFLIY